MREKIRMNLGVAVLLGAVLAFQSSVQGSDYFVNKQGSNTNDGMSRTAAFLTVQKGVDALKPGDTLTIGPGEYFETVMRVGLGNAESETVIRAEIPGTVVLRGDAPASEFEKVEGYRFVYAAALDRKPEAVLDHAATTLLEKRPNVAELEFEPGSFFYDGKSNTLFISTTDGEAPDGRLYTVAVARNSGLHLEKPRRVTIEGLSVKGFYRAMVRRPGWWVDDYQWGIVLDEPTSCTVRDCCAFLNCAGIGLNNGRGNVVERCLAHDNYTYNIQYFGGDNNIDNVARNCRAYRGEGGVDFYTTFSGTARIENCVAWDNALDYSTKGTDSDKFAFMEGCVALSNIRIHNLKNCILGGQDNEYAGDGKYTRDNIVFMQEKDLAVDREFADPINMDWRLQSNSRFRGAREDEKDRGVFPEYDYRIFFVDPDGNDENEGTSLGKAWKTLQRAVRELKPGDTLYLTEGVYTAQGRLTLGGPGAEKIRICGRGRDRVVVEGGLNLMDSVGLELERLSFAETTNVKDAAEITFTNCTLHGLNASNVTSLKVTHGLFTSSLRLGGTSGVYLSGNIFANIHAPGVLLDGENAILYSDYNSYQDGTRCWVAGGKTRSLDDLRSGHDRYSSVLKPDVAVDENVSVLTNPDVFAGRTPEGTSVGRYQEYEEKTPSVIGPVLHSVTDTTVNIEWWTSGPTTCEVAWGDTPAMEHSASSLNRHVLSSVYEETYRFTTFSLDDLEPGRKYYFAIRSIQTVSDEAAATAPVALHEAALTFTTATKAPEPKTYFVAPDGDNENTGLSREKAWRTVGHAASQVLAGDTVLIAGGTYREMVRLRASGAPDRPVTFQCMPGEKVIFDGDGRAMPNAIILNRKQHVRLDGLYFKNYADSVIALFQCKDVRVTRCFSDGRGPGYAGPLMVALNCSNVTVRNCVSIDGFGEGIYLAEDDGVLIEHNVFLRELIYSVVVKNDRDQKVVMRKNIFTDSLPFKSQVPNFHVVNAASLVEQDNCYYMRLPDDKRAMFNFVENADLFGGLERVGLGDYQKVFGDTGSYLGNPWFKGTVGMKEGEITRDRGVNYPVLLSDKLVGKPDLDFPDLFATDARAVEKSIGLVAADFEDFWFNAK